MVVYMSLKALVVTVLMLCTPISGVQQKAPSLVFNLQDSYSINPRLVTRLQLCIFSGTPPPIVTWTYNNNKLSSSADSGGVYYQQGNGTLVLDKASADNNGIYNCTGTNSQGMKSASTEIVFVRQSAPWYASWYMWFLYAIIIWGISIFFFVGWFFYCKKKAFDALPPPDEWLGN